MAWRLTAKGRSIRSTTLYQRRAARIGAKSKIQLSRVAQRTAVRTARIKGRSTRKMARVTKRAAIGTAGYTARSLHRAASPSGRKFRIYKGRKQRWSKKFGGWLNIKSPQRRAKKEVEEITDLAKTIKEMMPLILLLKGVGT